MTQALGFVIGGERLKGASPSILFISPHTVCSGTLIKDNVILTAAHCITDYESPENFLNTAIQIVSFKSQNKVEILRVYNTTIEQVHLHPTWLAAYQTDLKINPNTISDVYDLALITLKEKVGLPVASLVQNMELEIKTVHIVGGGGQSIENPKDLSVHQKRVELPVVKRTPYVLYMDAVDVKTKTPASVYFADSGGGTFIKNKNGKYSLVGVNSHMFGDGDSVETLKHIKTTASASLMNQDVQSWIYKNLEEQKQIVRPAARIGIK